MINGLKTEKILVIKLSALGDFILALGAMEAIRRHHVAAHITLLTTRPFLDIAQRSGYFDSIILDTRPAFYALGEWYSLFKKLNAGHFTHVYNLQLNRRTAWYSRLFLHKPEWPGSLPGSALSCSNPDWRNMHAFTRHREFMKLAGIDVQLPDLSWMNADISPFGIKKPFVLLVPGSAPRHPEKRWPVKHFSALALRLARDGYQSVILGTETESDVTERLAKSCPGALDLTGKTSLYEIAAMAREATAAIGNDTGPMHLIAQAGCPVVVLFNARASSAALSAPVGKSVRVIETDDLNELSPNEVYKEFNPQEGVP